MQNMQTHAKYPKQNVNQ